MEGSQKKKTYAITVTTNLFEDTYHTNMEDRDLAIAVATTRILEGASEAFSTKILKDLRIEKVTVTPL